MSEAEIAQRRLTLTAAVDIKAPTKVSVVRLDDGQIVETVTLLRYAGRYGATNAFAIKNAKGKFSVRGAAQLGLTTDSPYALIA